MEMHFKKSQTEKPLRTCKVLIYVSKAMLACKNSGFGVADQFPEVRKLIEHVSGAKREIVDYQLSRYACYLIMQNGDPRKEVIALGQTYFAIQTRRQEVADYFNRLN